MIRWSQQSSEEASARSSALSSEAGPATRSRLSTGSLYLAVFAVALILRLAHVFAMTNSPYFSNPVIDEGEYEQTGWAIAQGKGHPEKVFWHPPGYACFLGMVWAVAGDSYLAPRVVQAVLGALSVVLLAWIGGRLFGRAVGLAAGTAGAFYGMFVYFDGELLPPTLANFLVLATVALALLAKASGKRWLWACAGGAGGLASIVVATALVVSLLVAGYARRRAGWVVLGLGLAIAPVTIRNAALGGRFELISSNGGINLWIGNNPRYQETVSIRPDVEWRRLVSEPTTRSANGKPIPAYFVRRVLAWAKQDPVAFVRLQLHKLRLLVAGNEIYRNHAIYPARVVSPILWLLLWKVPGLAFPFGLLLPLAGLGLAVGARQARFLAAIAGGLALMVVAFFVTARYRVTIVPFLLIFAAYGVQWFARQAGRRARLIAAVSVAGLFLLANVGQDPMETRMNADAEYALAMRVGNRGRLQQAAVLFESAVASRPDYAEAWLNLCASYHRLGRPQDAQTAMDRALTADLPGTLEAMRAFADSGDPTLVGPLGAYLRESAARRLRNAAQAPQATPPSKDR